VNHQDVMVRVQRANPVPSDEDLPGAAWSDTELLRVIDERTATMRELMNDPELERAKQRPRRWRVPVLAAVAAFALALGAVGVVAVITHGEAPVDPANTPTTLAPPAHVRPRHHGSADDIGGELVPHSGAQPC